MKLIENLAEEIEAFREHQRGGRVIVCGDFNMGIAAMRNLNAWPGVPVLTRMHSLDLDFTWRRTAESQTKSHPDQIFSDTPLSNVRKIKEPN
jgi:hypothetical protein